jgi:hypothetical protein
MRLIPLLFFAISFLLFSHFAQAQTPGGKISGLVLDNTKKPLDGATVILLATKDSAIISKQLAQTDGTFTFLGLKDGSYLVEVTYIGYKNYKSGNVVISGQNRVKLPAITLLSSSSKTLNEVAVTAQKSYVEQKIDRTVVNVNALISNSGANALEVLEKTPGVQVDADGNITFKGKSGVLVMIDDKPTYLSAANLATYLKSLPSSELDQIELMDNPPAKYDAAGNAGVINIKTKKNTKRGFNGIFSAGYSQGFYGRSNESLNLNYRVDKVNIFANVAYNEEKDFRRLEIDRTYLDANNNPTSSLAEISYFRPMNYNTDIIVGMDYYS